MGVANRRSIAWAIATAAADAGAQLVLTYQAERVLSDVRALATTLPTPTQVLACDVSNDEDVESLKRQIEQTVGGLDFVVHCIAQARREDLERGVLNTDRDGFRLALEVSAYSLTSVARAMVPLLETRGGGSILTLTYLGGERVVSGYNIMGIAKAALEHSVRYLATELGPRNIRVNAISAGPLRTLAARAIPDFVELHRRHAEKAPLRRNIEVDEVADAALFLLGPMSRGVTGETLHVDAGYHLVGLY
ncbi:MAG: enoyl-ACP reductase [Candidatus Riflebacteria bacterium]|nr:enoyl-ACP reductase [Candidatus Riflebacteria bacterium]